MIHLLNDSPYVGYVEKVSERIMAVLTEETRKAILTIKNSIHTEKNIMGIQIYKAVIKDGIRDVDSFWKWKNKQSANDIIKWIP